MNIAPEILALHADMQRWRRHIHQHPETAFEETATARLIAGLLQSAGIEVHQGLAKTGIVGVLRRGNSSNSIALRADMDALYIQEQNRFDHASCHSGKMHACGHDGHTAMLLAAAQHFSKNRNFDGTVYLIFQPAEEGGGGAREMIRDGLFERFPVEAVFGMHNWPGMAVGHFAVSPGPVMASSNEFKITITGKGGHAALPYMGVDPVPIACQIVQGCRPSSRATRSRWTRPWSRSP